MEENLKSNSCSTPIALRYMSLVPLSSQADNTSKTILSPYRGRIETRHRRHRVVPLKLPPQLFGNSCPLTELRKKKEDKPEPDQYLKNQRKGNREEGTRKGKGKQKKKKKEGKKAKRDDGSGEK